MITKKIYIDFGQDSIPPTIFAKQGDIQSRFVEITPLDNGQLYSFYDGTTARVGVTKPDGNCVLNDVTITNGIITVELDQQILAVEGIATAEIILYYNGEVLSSQIFYINVSKSAVNPDKIESSSEYKTFENALTNLNQAIITANNLVANMQAAIANANSALPKTGGTMSGNIDMNWKNILNVSTLTSGKITSRVAPVNAVDVPNKSYVDNLFLNTFKIPTLQMPSWGMLIPGTEITDETILSFLNTNKNSPMLCILGMYSEGIGESGNTLNTMFTSYVTGFGFQAIQIGGRASLHLITLDYFGSNQWMFNTTSCAFAT